MADQTLKVLRRYAQESLDAQRLFKTTRQGEKEAEAAFGEFHMNLDERSILALIDAVESAQKLADGMVWLAQNHVVATETDGVVRNQLAFAWSAPAGDPKPLGQAVAEAMEGKSQILRA